jgi:MobC-like protein
MKETEIHPPIKASIGDEQSPPTSKRDKITEQKGETKKPKKEGKQWKEPEFKKTRRFNMVLTENEYVSLLQKAQHAKTVTGYILESCLTEKTDKIQPYKMNTELLSELGKVYKALNAIGTNINQTTKHINFLMKHELISGAVFKRQQNDLLSYTKVLAMMEERLSKLIK